MPPVEERLAYLEGRVEEHGRGMAGLGDAVTQFTHRMDGLDLKIGRFREELVGRIDAVDLKIDRFREELAGRIDAAEQKLAGRIDGLDQKLSRHFLWLVGMQVTVLLAVVGALLRG